MKKPFKETKLGKFLKSKGLDTVIDVAKYLPIPGVSQAANAIDDLKDAVTGTPEFKALPPEQQQEFNEAYKDYLSELTIVTADVQNAREMYKQNSSMSDRIANRIMNWNLPGILACLLILIACVKYFDNDVIIALISSTIGSVITLLATERQTVVNFFFGSSMGSKNNGETIRKMLNEK